MRKQLSFVLVVAMMILCVTRASASGSSPERAVNDFMKCCSNYNPSKIKACMAKGTKCVLYDNVHMNKVIKKYHKKFLEYEIVSSNVRKNSATVTLNVVYYDMSEDFDESYIELLKELHGRKSGTLDGSMKLWAKYFKEKYEDAVDSFENDEPYDPNDPDDIDGDREHITIKISLIKQGGAWKIKTVNKKMARFMDGGCSKQENYIKKHAKKYAKYFILG